MYKLERKIYETIALIYIILSCCYIWCPLNYFRHIRTSLKKVQEIIGPVFFYLFPVLLLLTYILKCRLEKKIAKNMTFSKVNRSVLDIIICKKVNVLTRFFLRYLTPYFFFRFSRRIRQFQAFLKRKYIFFKNAWICLIRQENRKKNNFLHIMIPKTPLFTLANVIFLALFFL